MTTRKQGTNLFGMLRDVLVVSLNKGQFLTAILGGIVIFMLWKMPPEDVSKLAFTILSDLKQGSYLVCLREKELEEHAAWLATVPLSYLDFTMPDDEVAEVILDWCIVTCRKQGGTEKDVRQMLKLFAGDKSLGDVAF